MNLTRTSKKRLLKLADFAETIPRKEFDMDEFGTPCGTPACVLGHAVAAQLFRDLRPFDNRTFMPYFSGRMACGAAAAFFQIKTDDALVLFYGADNHRTPKQVARNLRRYVESDGARLP